MNQSLNFLKSILKENNTIVLGLSGGPDSICLFHLLLSLKDKLNLKLIIAHVNHNIRHESEEEYKFVKKLAYTNKCYFEYLKLPKTKSNEATLRTKRYNFFYDTVKKYKANYLMTAHHGDDLVETILMRLTRGSNLNGYMGFKKVTKLDNFSIIRPLIYTTKEEILEYNKVHNLEYRIDKTNEQTKYTRNRYRKNILPFLKQENKNIHLKFLKFSEELELINDYLEKNTISSLTTCTSFGTIYLHKFKTLELIMQYRVLEYILKIEYKNDINLITDKHLKLIFKLINNNKPNGTINLPLNKTLIKNYDELKFQKESNYKMEEQILEDKLDLQELGIIEKIDKTDILKSNYILRLNSKEITLPLKVRTKKDKDKIWIKNMNNEKKLKDIFINEKIPTPIRNIYPIVTDAKDNILWIPGIKKSKFDKNYNEMYDIIYKYVISKEKN